MLCSANLQDRAVFAMCSFEGQLVIKDYTKISDRSGVIVDEPNFIVKNLELEWQGNKKLSLCQVELWCSFIHAECPPGSLRSVQLPLDHLVEKY